MLGTNGSMKVTDIIDRDVSAEALPGRTSEGKR